MKKKLIFEKNVANNVLKQLGLCEKCAHPTWRYTSSQVICRYKLMKPQLGIEFTDSAQKRLAEKYGCIGCTDIRFASLLCLLFMLRDLRVYDTRRRR